MIMAPKPGAGSPQIEYGTMLEIRSVQMLSDGRSMVETWGTFRFRILDRGLLDGYMVGRIERQVESVFQPHLSSSH
jgi:Lon protease-like protein